MKLLFSIFIALCSLTTIYAQKLQWVNATNYNQETKTVAMCTDTFGNVWHVAENSNDPRNTVIQKVNSNGTILWFGSIGPCKIVSIDDDSQGNIFLLGSFEGTSNVNPNISLSNSITANNSSSGFTTPVFILKLNNSGVFQFVRKIDGQGFNDVLFGWPQRIKVDHDDNVIFSIWAAKGGSIDIDPSNNIVNWPSTPGHNGIMIKWNNSCNQLHWFKTLPCISTNDQIIFNQVNVTPKVLIFDIDSRNQVYLSYRFNSALGVMKLSKDGLVLENSNNLFLNGAHFDYIEDIEVVSDNKIIFAGEFIDSINLDVKNVSPYVLNSPTTQPSSNVMIADAFIAMYDSTFNVLWGVSPNGTDYNFIEDIESFEDKIFVCAIGTDTTNCMINCMGGCSLMVYDTNGVIITLKQGISPSPTTVGGVPYLYGAAYAYVTNNSQSIAIMKYYMSWGRRILNVNNNEIYISGAFNTRSSTVSNYNYIGGYENNFNWKICDTGFYYVASNELLKAFLSKYTFIETPPVASFTDTVFNVCLNSNNSISIQNGYDGGCNFQWQWFAGNCNGQPIHTGSTYNFTATNSMDLYVRSVGNGIIGPCTHITVNVNSIPSFTLSSNILLDGPFTVTATNTTQNQANHSFQWLWGDGTNIFNNNITVDHTYPINSSTYTIKLISYHLTSNCPAMTTCTNCITTGYTDITEMVNSNYFIVPNPTSGQFQIHNIVGEVVTEVYDMFNRKVAQFNSNEGDITNLSSGIYFIKCVNNDSMKEFKLVKR